MKKQVGGRDRKDGLEENTEEGARQGHLEMSSELKMCITAEGKQKES